MKPLIIGQAPGRSAKAGERALEGESPTGSGARLARVMGLDSPSELFDIFDTVNLLECWPGSKGGKGDAFPKSAARARAQTLVFPNHVIILLGRNVATAFNRAGDPPLKWIQMAGRVAGIVPHPSGIVRWWNAKKNVTAAANFLWQAVAIADSVPCRVSFAANLQRPG